MNYQDVDTNTIIKNMRNLITFTWNAAETAKDGTMDASECATVMEIMLDMLDNLSKSIEADAAMNER